MFNILIAMLRLKVAKKTKLKQDKNKKLNFTLWLLYTLVFL